MYNNEESEKRKLKEFERALQRELREHWEVPFRP